jgi:hypothetical protein
VAALLLGIYLLTTGGQPFISDGEVMFITTTRIVDEHTLTLPTGAAVYPQVLRRQDGSLFSRYGLGQPLAAAPLYAFGRYVLGVWLWGSRHDFQIGRFFALLLPAIATALTGGLLCAWAIRLYSSARLGVALALLYGLGTLAWPYSRFFFSEPLFTAALVLAALAIDTRRPALAGAGLGYAVATRIGGVVLLPAFLIYAWLKGHRSRDFMSMGLGLLPFGLLVLAHNWLRFRTFNELGYGDEGFTGDLLAGLYGLLFSPGKSVFLYVPLLLALPFAAAPFVRRFRPEAALVGSLAAITLLQSALWWIWWGGWGWGPRFLVPLMPFLTLMLGVLIERPIWRRIIFLVLLPLSLAVNLLGILVDFNGYIIDITHGDINREAIYLFQPAYSPILGHLRRLDLSSVPIVSFSLGRTEIGFAEPWATWISISFVALAFGALVGLLRSLRRSGRVEADAPSATFMMG